MDDPVAWFKGSKVENSNLYHLRTNHQGSIVLAAPAQGSDYINAQYDEWGQWDDASGMRFGYTGQIWIKELGLWHYKARMYSPELGRFMQTDPVGYEDQFNMYAYVGNDPLNMNDPSGKFAVMSAMAINAGIAMGVSIATDLAFGNRDVGEMAANAAVAGATANIKMGVAVATAVAGAFTVFKGAVKGDSAAETGKKVIAATASTAAAALIGGTNGARVAKAVTQRALKGVARKGRKTMVALGGSVASSGLGNTIEAAENAMSGGNDDQADASLMSIDTLASEPECTASGDTDQHNC